MVDFARARALMIENQLRAGGVTDPAIIASMRAVPREDFVAIARRDLAYIDDIQWLGERAAGRFMAAPATLAKLLKLAEITATDTVLDIGSGTGYSTAVIAGLAASVTGLEADSGLAAMATANLAGLGLSNTTMITGELPALGARRFDVIIVQGALPRVPDALMAALTDTGRLVILIRSGPVSVAHLLVKSPRGVSTRTAFSAALPSLQAAPPNEEFVF